MRPIKILAVMILFLYITPVVNAQSTTILSDGFEAGLAKWDEGTTLWFLNNADPHTGIYYITSTDTVEGAIISDPMDTSDASSIDIAFWYRHIQTEANNFVFSLWDGTQFVDYVDLSTAGVSGWNQYTIEITDAKYFITDFRIRFFSNLESGEYAFLDDLIITKNTDIYTITYDVNGKGSIQSTPSGPYSNGVDVDISAVPNNGWSFSSWAGDLSGTTNPDTLTITGNMAVSATFVPSSYIQVSTSKSSYNRLEKVTLQITDGTPFGSALIQLNQGTTVQLIDQRELNSVGSLNYVFKIPSNWALGTYTIHVKDANTDTIDTSTFQVPVPSPPSPPPSGGGPAGGPSLILPSIKVINLLSAKEASKMLDDFDADKVANLLGDIENKTHVVWIIQYFKPSYARSVLRELENGYAAEIMIRIREDTASSILTEFRSGEAVIIDIMLDYNFTHSSELIERSVKIIESMESGEKQAYLDGFGSSLGLVNKTRLIESLIFIYSLPETPSTVVSILDLMNTSNVLDLISIWLENPAFTGSRHILAGLFELFPQETVSTLYMGMNGSHRIVLLDYLSDSVIYSLPVIGLFEVSQLWVHQTDISPGDTIEFSYTLMNAGEETDDYIIPIDIDGEIVFTDEGILGSLESTIFEHSVTLENSGTYRITVFGETIELEVVQIVLPEPLSPAEIIVTALEVVPNLVESGDIISIFVTLKNLGELGGVRDIPLYIDSFLVESKEAFIIANGQTTLVFDMPIEYSEGHHQILVGEESSSFEVYTMETGSRIPYLTIFTIIAIIVISAYYARNRSDLSLREILRNILPQY